MAQRHRSIQLSWKARAAFALLGLVVAQALTTSDVKAKEEGLRDIGVLDAGLDFGRPSPQPPGLIIDPVLHKGFLFQDGIKPEILVYDLRELRLIQRVPTPSNFRNSTRPYAVVDSQNHRVFMTDNLHTNQGLNCDDQSLWILDTATVTMTRRPIPCLTDPVKTGFAINGISFDETSQKLYVVGLPAILAEDVYFSSTTPPRQPTIIRQFDPNTLTSDWDADISDSCEWHQDPYSNSATVVRSGDHIVLYCFDGGVNNPTGTGGRGAAVVVPLENGRPVRKSDAVVTSRSGTFTDQGVLRVVDPVSGRLILVASQRPFGPAAWVYDPKRKLFNGVVPTGVDPNKERSFDYGFDKSTGRLYIHSSRGIVVVDARHTPLPGGVTHPIAAHPISGVRGAVQISIDGPLRRLFIPSEDHKGWRVIEDRSPPPPDVEPPDPDAGTADIPEQAGVTDRSFSASANAFGVHVLAAGGIPTIIHQLDAREDCVHRFADPSAPCLADVAFSPGNREYYLAQTSLQQAMGSGASAFGTTGRTAPRDYATDADVRSLGNCYGDRAAQVHESGQGLQDACPETTPWGQFTNSTPLESVTFERLRGGTAPRASGEDFLISGSYCSDFGLGATEDADAAPLGIGESAVGCDLAKAASSSRAESRSSTLGQVAQGQPLIKVGRSFSRVTSRLDPKLGIVTDAEAVVENVVIGDVVSISGIRTVATTRAFGRSGTTLASGQRTFTGVRTPTYSCDSTTQCDPSQVIAGINAAFGTVVAPRTPEPYVLASPRGYTALVAKDPDLAASDSAMNDDDTVTFNGLDLVIINDYNRDAGADGQQNAARSRTTISLAGVQAESHYGVFPAPRQLSDDGPNLSSVLLGPSGMELAGPYGLPSVVQPPSVDIDRGNRLSPAPTTTFPRTIQEAIRIIVNNPGQAALLALFLAILASPMYLAVRRRLVAPVWQT